MNLSRDSALALQRHYVGTLSKPVTTWLEPLPATRLAFSGTAIRVDDEGCILDFGTVDAARGEKRGVRVFQPGKRPAAIRVSEAPGWVAAEWVDNGSLLVVQITDDGEGERCETLSLWVRDDAGARLEKLRVRVAALPQQPSANISFNGLPAPRSFAFGFDGGAYTISVANTNSVPLIVSFADLPAWLELTVDGCSRSGPIAGLFFERRAPFTVSLRPQVLGHHAGFVRMQTNDRRPEFRNLTLEFTASIAPLRPHVRTVPPQPVAASRRTVTAHARLENWGRSPASVTASVSMEAITVPRLIRIPAANDGVPGKADLPIRIAASRLAPGAYTLIVSLQVEDGDPPHCSVPLHVNVPAARRSRGLRAETIAAILALLLLTVVLLAAAGAWS